MTIYGIGASEHFTHTWIEGVGSTYNPLFPVGYMDIVGGSSKVDTCLCNDGVFYESKDHEQALQKYFPEGTKWTEIRLDTTKYDSWYTKSGDDWVANFETVEYSVKGEYTDKNLNNWTFKKVYTSGENWTDSLTLLLSEGEYGVDVTAADFYDNVLTLFPTTLYQLQLEVGMMLEFRDIERANCTCIIPPGTFDFGEVEEIKEGDFGGKISLKYADVNGIRIVQGIGVVNWNDGECLFGPLKIYDALPKTEVRHYRSMLVRFERNGEVLYDQWPVTDGIKSINNPSPVSNDNAYDISGRKVPGKPQHGLYIKDGKKVIQ